MQALARSREGAHAYAVGSRAGSGLSGGKSREIGDWDDSREEGSGVGEGGGNLGSGRALWLQGSEREREREGGKDSESVPPPV